MTAERGQLRVKDFADGESIDAERLAHLVNELMLATYLRLEALEAVKGIYVLPDISIEIGGTYSAAAVPFGGDSGLRVACPFTPTGLVVLGCVRTQPAGQPVLTSAVDVKWQASTGPGNVDQVRILFVTGLAVGSRYRLRVGVTRE